MSDTTGIRMTGERHGASRGIHLKELVGSGEKIGAVVLPVLVVGVALNILRPSWFSVGGPSSALTLVSAIVLVPGIAIWLWSVVLILTRVPKHELITTGPFALVKHPLYTAVALLVLPWAGFLLDTWLGAVLGVVLYAASRKYAPDEERELAEAFGDLWDEYRERVMVPWL